MSVRFTPESQTQPTARPSSSRAGVRFTPERGGVHFTPFATPFGQSSSRRPSIGPVEGAQTLKTALAAMPQADRARLEKEYETFQGRWPAQFEPASPIQREVARMPEARGAFAAPAAPDFESWLSTYWMPKHPETFRTFPTGVKEFDPLMAVRGLKVGAAERPAAAIAGITAFTPGTPAESGVDRALLGAAEKLRGITSADEREMVSRARTGRLWPVDAGDPFWRIRKEHLGEVANAWQAAVGEHVPLMAMTVAGGALGRLAAVPVATLAAAAAAVATGGPDPSDVVTIPLVAGLIKAAGGFTGGAVPLVLSEAEGFLEAARELGIDEEIAEKYARQYGLGSGAIEYMQIAWNLKAYKNLFSTVAGKALVRRIMSEAAGIAWEGVEEGAQQRFQNHLLAAAVEEMKIRHPDFAGVAPEPWAGVKRSAILGAGLSGLIRAPGHAAGAIGGRQVREGGHDELSRVAPRPAEAWPAHEVTGKPALEILDEALAEGITDEGTHRLATAFLKKNPGFDAHAALTISDAVKRAESDVLESYGLDPEKGGIISGETRAGFENGILRASVRLYQGHAADTFVHEVYEAAWILLGETHAELRGAFEKYHAESGDARPAHEHFAEMGSSWALGSETFADLGPVEALFERAKEILAVVMRRIREVFGGELPPDVERIFRAVVEGEVFTEEARGAQEEPIGPGDVIEDTVTGKRGRVDKPATVKGDPGWMIRTATGPSFIYAEDARRISPPVEETQAFKKLRREAEDVFQVREGEPGFEAKPQPWEMTREEFDKRFLIHATETAEGFVPQDRLLEGTRPGQRRFFRDIQGVVLTRKGQKVISGPDFNSAIDGRDAVVYSTDQDVVKAVEAGHQAVVEKALAEGESVPPEVLADYPDLAEKAGQTPRGLFGEIGEEKPQGPVDLFGEPIVERAPRRRAAAEPKRSLFGGAERFAEAGPVVETERPGLFGTETERRHLGPERKALLRRARAILRQRGDRATLGLVRVLEHAKGPMADDLNAAALELHAQRTKASVERIATRLADRWAKTKAGEVGFASAEKEPWEMTREEYIAKPFAHLPPPKAGMMRVYHGTRRDADTIRREGLHTGRDLGTAEAAPVVFGFTRPGEFYGPRVVVFDIADEPGAIGPRVEVSSSGEVRINRAIGPAEIVDIVELGDKQIGELYPELQRGALPTDIYSAERMGRMHGEMTRYAAEQGKPVPPEALADYPDLVAPEKPGRYQIRGAEAPAARYERLVEELGKALVPPQVVTDIDRRKLVREALEEMTTQPGYQAGLEAAEAEGEQGFAGQERLSAGQLYSVGRNFKGEVTHFVGKPGEKGGKQYLWLKHLCWAGSQRAKSAVPWDTIMDSVEPGEVHDITDFLERLDHAVRASREEAKGVNSRALDIAITDMQDIGVELAWTKWSLLKEGYGVDAVNASLSDVVQQAGGTEEDAMKEFLEKPPERTRTRRQMVTDKLRGRVLKALDSAHRLGLEEERLRAREEIQTARRQMAAVRREVKEGEEAIKAAAVEDARAKWQKQARTKNQYDKELKQSLWEYLRPISMRVRGKFMRQIDAVRGPASMQRFQKAVDKAAQAELRREYIDKIERALVTGTPRPGRAGYLRGWRTPEVEETLDALRSRRHWTRERAVAQQEGNITAAEKGAISWDEMLERNELLNYAGFRELPLEQLARLYDEIRYLKHAGRMRAADIRLQRREMINSFARRGLAIVTGGAGLKPGTRSVPSRQLEVKKGAFDWLSSRNMGIESLLDKISRLDRGSKPYQSEMSALCERIVRSRGLQQDGIRRNMELLTSAAMEIYGAKSRAGVTAIFNDIIGEEHDLGEFANTKGEKMSLVMTRGQAMKKYQEMQDPTLDDTFQLGMYWTPEMMKAVENLLSGPDKAWANWMMQFYQDYYDGINEVYGRVYGIDLPHNRFYSPLSRDVDNVKLEAMEIHKELGRFATASNRSLKSRVQNIHPLGLPDANAVLANHITQMEHFKAFAENVGFMREVFRDPDLRAGIQQYHGRDILRQIDSALADIARDGVNEMKTVRGIDLLRRNLTRSLLAGKPNISLKQIPSLFAYLTEMSARDFVSGVVDFWKHPLDNYRTLRDNSPILRARFAQGFERDIHYAQQQRKLAKRITGKGTWVNALMLHIRVGDAVAVVQGNWAAYQSGLKQGMSADKAMRHAERVMQRTQPSWEMETLSSWQRGGSWMKLMTMFQTQINKYYRIITDNTRNLIAGRGSRAKALSNIFLTWVVFPSIFQLVADGFRFKPERQARAWILGPFNKLLIVGNFLDLGYDYAVAGVRWEYEPAPIIDIPKRILSALKRVGKMWRKGEIPDFWDTDVQRLIEDLAIGGGELTGMPTPALYQGIRAVREAETPGEAASRFILRRAPEEPEKATAPSGRRRARARRSRRSRR